MVRTFARSRFLHASVIAVSALLAFNAPASADAKPAIAVLDFDTEGLTSSGSIWWGQFKPGVALSDLVTDQLVNGHKFNVLERNKLGAVMAEHQLSTGGEVAPATVIQTGRLTGARYLVTGNVLQLDRTGRSGGTGALGGFRGGLAGALASALDSERVTLKVQVHIVDAMTGSIVQSYQSETTKKANSFSVGGSGSSWNTAGSGTYSNSNFVSSTMGHLINDEAIDIAGKLDPSQFASAPAPAVISGRIIAADSDGIILNIGSNKGVQSGMFFDVMRERHIKDPDSGKILSVTSPTGKMQVIQVNADSAVAKHVAGTITVGDKVNAAP